MGFLDRVFDLATDVWGKVVISLLSAAVIAILVRMYAKLRSIARGRRKILVYISAGGTCRDPMAKAITQELLRNLKLRHPVDVYAFGMNPHDDEKEASLAAQKAIEEMYGRNLLKDHKPTKVDSKIMDQADLVLVMDRYLLEGNRTTFPSETTHLLKKFFLGIDGDVEDPFRWSGRGDPETLKRYQACAEELRGIIYENKDKLLRALDEI